MHSSGLNAAPEWYKAYFTAVLEADDQKALIQLKRATKAMEDRLVQLQSEAREHPEELQDLSNALTYLCLLLANINPDCVIAIE